MRYLAYTAHRYDPILMHRHTSKRTYALWVTRTPRTGSSRCLRWAMEMGSVVETQPRLWAYYCVRICYRTNPNEPFRLEAALRTLLQRRLSLRLHRLMDGSEMIARITRPVGNIAAGLVCFRTAGTAGALALTLRFGTGRQGTAAGWLGVSLVSSRSSASERSRPVDRFVLGASRGFGSRSRLSPSFKLTALWGGFSLSHSPPPF